MPLTAATTRSYVAPSLKCHQFAFGAQLGYRNAGAEPVHRRLAARCALKLNKKIGKAIETAILSVVVPIGYGFCNSSFSNKRV